MNPLVSILLPFRDAVTWLDRAIASVHAQTYRNWELLLIDNGSTDNGPTIAREWSARDPRIRLVHEPVVGIAHALNTGLRDAQGDLIARMDADDESHPERLHRQVVFMNAHPEIGVLGTRTRFVSSVAQHSGMHWFVAWQNAILSPHDHYVKRFVDAPLAHPTVMFRRELVGAHGAYDTGPLPEDHELWLRWMHGGVRFAKLPEELLTWHDHAGRLSRTHPNYEQASFFRMKALWLSRWLERHPERAVIIAGTSALCQSRAELLRARGTTITAFTDVRDRPVPGTPFIPALELPGPGVAVIVSLISQRGTGDRIAAFLRDRGSVEGRDFILAA